MHKTLAVFAIALALAGFGCAGTQTKEEPVTKETKVRCPKCGYPFEVGEGMRLMERSR